MGTNLSKIFQADIDYCRWSSQRWEHISLNVVNLQHMLSLGGIDVRFISTTTAVSKQTGIH